MRLVGLPGAGSFAIAQDDSRKRAQDPHDAPDRMKLFAVILRSEATKDPELNGRRMPRLEACRARDPSLSLRMTARRQGFRAGLG